MSRRKLPALACFALACAYALSSARAGSAQDARPAPATEPAQVFHEARAVNPSAAPEQGVFEFEMHGFAYHVSANGNGRRTKGARARGFNLRLDPGESIARVFYAEFEGDVLLLLHTTLAGAGVGFVTRLEQPSMRGRWRQRIGAPEVGEPLRDGRHLYVTGAGFVGKLDLRTGEYAWHQEGLEDVRGDEPQPFKAFDPPELTGDEVLFRERPVYNPRRTLVLDRKSGKVIRVE
jgi:hypothetical protein